MIAEQLKKSILQAAIQGKLTEQLPSDGDAHDLLKKIQKEKEQLTREGKIKKEKPLPEITEDELPFDIPENWCWVRLGDITSKIGSGSTPRGGKEVYQKTGIPFIRSQNVWNNGLSLENIACITEKTHEKMAGTKVIEGDNLLNITGASIGRTCLVPKEFKDGNVSQHVSIVRLIDKRLNSFLHLILMSPYVQNKIMNIQVGISREGLSKKNMERFPIPLAPIAEQNRITDHLNKVLPELDYLETDECRLDVLQRAFPRKMRDSVLQYAVMGKLTERLPSDGDAHDLLKDIQREKDRLFKEGKIKKEKPLPEIADDELPFGIPENWCWVRLGSISFDHGQKRPDTDFTYIDISSINNDANILGNLNNIIKPNEAPSRARKIVFKGDVIYATVRPYLHNICLIDREIIPKPIVSTGFAVVCTPKPLLNNYLFYCFLSPMFDSYANDNDNSKGVAYPAINDDKFSKALIPLPPLEEQRRIVHRLEELLPEIGKLGTKTLTVG